MTSPRFAICIPMANEETSFSSFIAELSRVIDAYPGVSVYLITDKASADATPELCLRLQQQDSRYHAIWAPENKNVVDAYLRGFREAMREKPDFIIEMDGGGSHAPQDIPAFVEAMAAGYECAFGSRYIEGGSMEHSPFRRRFLSRFGSFLARALLSCPMQDATSGFEAFRYEVMERLLAYPLRSRAHFYQTELRYLLRHSKWIEVPIHYTSPSPRVSRKALLNACQCLFHYALSHLNGKGKKL